MIAVLTMIHQMLTLFLSFINTFIQILEFLCILKDHSLLSINVSCDDINLFLSNVNHSLFLL